MRLVTILAAALLGVCAATQAVVGAQRIRDLRSGETLPGLEAVAARAADADLIVIGEIHDNPAHQRNQAELARLIGVRAAAFEMIPRAAEDEIAALRRDGAAAALRAAAEQGRYARWLPVLEAIPDAAIIGAGLPRAAISRAIEEGAAAAFDGDAALWGLDAPPPAEVEAEMEAEQIAVHCDALPARMAPGMVSAQRLRDASFAAALLRARDAAGGGKALLVTGNGHARRDRGVPAYLARVAPEARTLVIGQTERGAQGAFGEQGAFEGTDGAPLYDIVIVTDPAPREDPCLRFLKSRGQGG